MTRIEDLLDRQDRAPIALDQSKGGAKAWVSRGMKLQPRWREWPLNSSPELGGIGQRVEFRNASTRKRFRSNLCLYEVHMICLSVEDHSDGQHFERSCFPDQTNILRLRSR